MPKKKKRRTEIPFRRGRRRGFVEILLIIVVIALGVLLSGLFKNDFTQSNTPIASAYTCCDTGNGKDCHAQTDKKITFNGQDYGLLKSGVTFAEGNCHLADSGTKTSGGDPIIKNTSDGYARFVAQVDPGSPAECGLSAGDDQVWGPANNSMGVTTNCTPIKNDELVYVCRKNCVPGDRTQCVAGTGVTMEGNTVYGTRDTVYDVYFRLADVNDPGIPDVIKNCVNSNSGQTSGTSGTNSEPTIVITQFPERKNLQLETFTITQNSKVPWLSPWCKPAVYLYPTQTSFVNVKIGTSEPLTYSDPLYPTGGWNVLASPTGNISYANKNYDYLYYETRVQDSDIAKPTDGFVFAKNDLKNSLSQLLPKLGLNTKETSQFVDYWTKALPASPYYFVGVVKQNQLDAVDPLEINPKPNTVIRITLYFETLANKIDVNVPKIEPVFRSGFTVVEWGGIFKKHPNENFSCLM